MNAASETGNVELRGSGSRLRPTLIAAIWTVPAVLACLQTWATNRLAGHHVDFVAICAAQLPAWYLWAAMTPALFWLAREAPPEWPLRMRTLSIHALAWIVCLAAHAAAIATAAILLDNGARPSVGAVWRIAVLSWIPSTFLLYCATIGAAAWMRSTQRERARERAGARVEAELNETRARAELDALRNQLHPHFLFNALNTVAVLVRSGNAAAAEHVIAQLGGLLRDLLRTTESQEDTLRNEIRIVARYLDIEQIRFGSLLRIAWNVPDDCLDARVPVLLLQPLVENAIRHGVAARESGGAVQIDAMRQADALLLHVLNDASPDPPAAAQSTGIGLQNTRRRLDRLYGARGVLDLTTRDGQTRVRISLPYHVDELIRNDTAPSARVLAAR